MNKNKSGFYKFMALWTGEFISAIGSGLTAFGLSVYVFKTTGMASATAIIAILAFLPPILLSSVSGVLADRYDRRLMMILGDSLSVIGLVYILICMYMGNVKFWQICIGVAFSSLFSSLMDPAYKATVTDLLTEGEYTRASGLVQITSSAKYLISPVIAGYIMAVSDIRLILILDISTFFITVTTTLAVKNGISSRHEIKDKTGFVEEFKTGWKALTDNKGVFALVMVASVLTFFMGFIQILSTPMVLAFANSSRLGTIETLIACGMLVSSMIIGFIPIKRNHVKILCSALFVAGFAMIGFGCRENIVVIGLFGFLFFASLPFANSCLDYLVRSNIENEVQGRVWSLIGIISQIGYVFAYAGCGIMADYVFTPMLMQGGLLSGSIGRIIGTGSGRGSAFLIIIAGFLMSITALGLYGIKSVKMLEDEGGEYVLESDLQ